MTRKKKTKFTKADKIRSFVTKKKKYWIKIFSHEKTEPQPNISHHQIKLPIPGMGSI